MKKTKIKADLKPFDWADDGKSYAAMFYENERYVYYDYYPIEKREPQNPERFSYSFVDEKYNDYTTLVVTPKILDLHWNETSLSDEELLQYIATEIFREENESARQKNNARRAETRLKRKALGGRE